VCAGLMVSLPSPNTLRAGRAVLAGLWRRGLACVQRHTDRIGDFDHASLEWSAFGNLAVAIMRRVGLVVALLGMAVAAHAAEPENGIVVRSLDLLTVQSVQFDANGLARLSRYRFAASIVPIHLDDAVPFGFGFSNASYLTAASGRQKNIGWTANSEWSRLLGSDRASLSPRLRIDSAGQRIEIVPRRHSVWLQWRKVLR
jgi:hypothetical protein